MNNKAPLLRVEPSAWSQALRRITRSTDERTLLSGSVPSVGTGDSASVLAYESARAVASALVMANMNSLPLDWAARTSVGGTNLSFFIVKQLPVLSPEAYLEEARCGRRFVELVVPRVLELTYTANSLRGFAEALGFEGPPFPWDEDRRHRLRSELDAIYAQLYGLDRTDLEWILDATPPSASFPLVKEHELKAFGEYRTSRYVLEAFDQLARGEVPSLSAVAGPSARRR